MTGKIASIDLSLKNIWQSWFKFKKGKKYTPKLHEFQYNLEENLHKMFTDLNSDRYQHGGYKKFIVKDNKRREISVCEIRDRILHRLVYEHLCEIYDKTFIFDAWSCRKGKGLQGAIKRTQKFMWAHKNGYVWKSDIKKFFDNVNKEKFKEILSRRIKDEKTFKLLCVIIDSFSAESHANKGIPIGNLTSQIFSNIYLNELDRFVKYKIKPKAYLRYGDDFILVESSLKNLISMKQQVELFIKNALNMGINRKSEAVTKAKHGLKFLGTIIYPKNRTLNKRNESKISKNLNLKNTPSYYGTISQNGSRKFQKKFLWQILKLIQETQNFTPPPSQNPTPSPPSSNNPWI